MRLDDLISLVEQRRAVHGDLRAHLPGWMAEGVRRRHAGELFLRVRTERSAARREDEFGKGGVSAEGKRLPDRRMFAVHGDEIGAALLKFRRDEISPAHERFLVRERDAHAERSRAQGIGKPREAARGDERDITPVERVPHRFFCGKAPRVLGKIAFSPVRKPRKRRSELVRERGERFPVFARDERGKGKFLRITADDGADLPADAPAASDERNFDHSLLFVKTSASGGRPLYLMQSNAST